MYSLNNVITTSQSMGTSGGSPRRKADSEQPIITAHPPSIQHVHSVPDCFSCLFIRCIPGVKSGKVIVGQGLGLSLLIELSLGGQRMIYWWAEGGGGKEGKGGRKGQGLWVQGGGGDSPGRPYERQLVKKRIQQIKYIIVVMERQKYRSIILMAVIGNVGSLPCSRTPFDIHSIQQRGQDFSELSDGSLYFKHHGEAQIGN